MAATVYLSESNGAGQVVTDHISNVNMGSADLPNLVAASHKIVIPLFGMHFSFTKWLRYKLDSLGGSNQIGNFKYYKFSGAYVGPSISEVILAGNQDGVGILTYSTPNNAVRINGIANAGAGAIPTGVVGSQMVPAGGSFSGVLNTGGTYTNYFLMQITIFDTCPSGPANQKVIRFLYDET